MLRLSDWQPVSFTITVYWHLIQLNSHFQRKQLRKCIWLNRGLNRGHLFGIIVHRYFKMQDFHCIWLLCYPYISSLSPSWKCQRITHTNGEGSELLIHLKNVVPAMIESSDNDQQQSHNQKTSGSLLSKNQQVTHNLHLQMWSMLTTNHWTLSDILPLLHPHAIIWSRAKPAARMRLIPNQASEEFSSVARVWSRRVSSPWVPGIALENLVCF